MNYPLVNSLYVYSEAGKTFNVKIIKVSPDRITFEGEARGTVDLNYFGRKFKLLNSTLPVVTSIPISSVIKEETWIQKIINWIKKILSN